MYLSKYLTIHLFIYLFSYGPDNPPYLGYVRRRVEAKLINWPFSPLRLASWLRTANIGSLTADPHPNHVVNFNQAKLTGAFARARPTSKGRKGRSPKQWFSNGIMVLNSKKRALFFSAGEQEMNMNAYEEYKTIIMAKFNTATAVRARCVGMFIGWYLCMNTWRQVSTGTEVSSTGLNLQGC